MKLPGWMLRLAPLLLAFMPALAFAQQNANLPGVNINFGQGTNLVDTIEVLILFTVLTFMNKITQFGCA